MGADLDALVWKVKGAEGNALPKGAPWAFVLSASCVRPDELPGHLKSDEPMLLPRLARGCCGATVALLLA